MSAAACASTSSSQPAPPGLPAFYSVPAGVAHDAPGALLKWQSLPVPGLAGSAARLMYVSTDDTGRSVAVTGLAYVPATVPPPGGFPVLSWVHGTNGLAARCAPSLDPATALPSLAALNVLLEMGWEVVATDIQGEGTPPGLLPYLVGGIAGRDAIDVVRAVRHRASAHAGRRYAVWGDSVGGQAALFVWKVAQTYGSSSGLAMVGVVAVAPPSEFQGLLPSLATTPYRVYLFMAIAGFHAVYGDSAPLGQVLTPEGIDLLPVLERGCLESAVTAVDSRPASRLFRADPYRSRAWRRLLVGNDPGAFVSGSGVPLLIVHGSADEQVAAGTSAELARHLCTLGPQVQRWLYPGASHGGVLAVSAADVTRWIASRFTGRGLPTDYEPSGEPGVESTACSPHG